MAYTPTNWTDGTSPVDASNLNKLEQAVSENSDLIDNMACKMTFTGTVDAMINDLLTLSTNEPIIFSTNGATTGFLINSSVLTATTLGIMVRNGNNFDYLMLLPAATSYIYCGRLSSSSATVTTLWRVSGTTVI